MEEVKDLSKQAFFNRDFSGMDLRGVPMHHSRFNLCKFVGANISGNDCSNADFSGSDMTDVSCNGTNFAHSILGCRFFPKDCYAMTLTLECRTFQGMLISKLWWMAWVYFATCMVVAEKEKGQDLNDKLITALGPDIYLKMKKLFDARRM